MTDATLPRGYSIERLPFPINSGGGIMHSHRVLYGGLPLKYFGSEAAARWWVDWYDQSHGNYTACACALPEHTCDACRRAARRNYQYQKEMGK